MVEDTQPRLNLDAGNPINKFVETIASIASQQRRLTSSAVFQSSTTNTVIFDGKNEKVELFENLFRKMLKMQPEMSEAT